MVVIESYIFKTFINQFFNKKTENYMLKEFGQFIMRGNVLDLAVGVIIGGAFNNIVTALVDKLIMPLVGIALGGLDFKSLSFKVGEASLGYGEVIQAVVNFVIIGFVLFMILRAYNAAAKKKDASYAPAPTPSEGLLADIKGLMNQVAENTKR
jgi:large conductance mechanosensitive channel